MELKLGARDAPRPAGAVAWPPRPCRPAGADALHGAPGSSSGRAPVFLPKPTSRVLPRVLMTDTRTLTDTRTQTHHCVCAHKMHRSLHVISAHIARYPCARISYAVRARVVCRVYTRMCSACCVRMCNTCVCIVRVHRTCAHGTAAFGMCVCAHVALCVSHMHTRQRRGPLWLFGVCPVLGGLCPRRRLWSGGPFARARLPRLQPRQPRWAQARLPPNTRLATSWGETCHRP